jgi:hypothetical protein
MISGGSSLVLHQQLHHHFIVDVHCRRLCKSPNTLRAWSAQVVAGTSGWAAELGEAGLDGQRLHGGDTRLFLWSAVARGAAAIVNWWEWEAR